MNVRISKVCFLKMMYYIVDFLLSVESWKEPCDGCVYAERVLYAHETCNLN